MPGDFETADWDPQHATYFVMAADLGSLCLITQMLQLLFKLDTLLTGRQRGH